MIELLLQAERALSVGLLDSAEALYRQVAAADPRNSIAVVGLARVALERGDEDQAIALGHQALEIDPENVAAQRLVQRLEEVRAYRASSAAAAPARGSVVAVQSERPDSPGGVSEPASAPASEPAPAPVAESQPALAVALEPARAPAPVPAAASEPARAPEPAPELAPASSPEPPPASELVPAPASELAPAPTPVVEPALASQADADSSPGPATPFWRRWLDRLFRRR
jgi:tetratricopeptide (TPR) repeat protein